MQLPGFANDLYTAHFYINAPGRFQFAKHRDWINNYGNRLMQSRVFGYTGVNFLPIVTAPPRQ